jgi:hypothetical protein
MRTLKQEDACLSNYAVDRWLVGQLSEDESRAMQEHVDDCPRCSLRCDELNRQRTAFYTRVPNWDTFEKRRGAAAVLPRPARRAWALPLMAAAGLLAIGVGVGVGFGSSELRSSASERSKGGPSIGFFVKRGEHIRRGITGEEVIPGELLRFTYSTERPLYFALLHADSAGATIQFPTQPNAARIDAGREIPLDFSIRLDSRLGTERVYGVFCEEAIALEPIRARLESSGSLSEVPRCRVDPVELKKRSP